MDTTRKPAQTPDYELEMLEGEMVLFHPASMKIIHSNKTGALIWQLCTGELTVAEITTLLSQAYPESSDDIAADVTAMLQLLEEHGAIQWRP